MINSAPGATNKHASYENFSATCPTCGVESVFNRASDLNTFEPISGRDVVCLNPPCGQPFRILGDRVNARHEMLLFDASDLLVQKRYMHAVLTACTAYEAMFSLFLRVELLYKPFGNADEPDIETLNRLLLLLDERIKPFTFPVMRKLFLKRLVAETSPETLPEAESMIRALSFNNAFPDDIAIEAIPCTAAVPVLLRLKCSTIDTLRNDIVHKRAYRPTREHATAAVDEARSVIHPLTSLLDLHDDLNLYLIGSKKSRTRWRAE